MTTLWSLLAQTQQNTQRVLENSASLSELATACAALDAELTEIPLGSRDLKFEEEGLLHNGQILRMDDISRCKLFEKIDAPAKYLTKHSPNLQAAALSEDAKRGMFGDNPMAVLRKGELFTIVPGELTNLASGLVVKAVKEELGTEGEGLLLAKIENTAEKLEVELVSPRKAVVVRAGDIVQAGISIVHPRYGNEATQIQTFFLRLACSNGMTRRECVSRNGIARTRRLPVGYPNGRELQLSQIRRLVRQNWNSLQTQLHALQASSARSANVEELLTRWLQRARIAAPAMMPRLIAAWRQEGAEQTQYGAINALTRVATHDTTLSGRQRRAFASLAGLLAFSEVHLCPRCFSILRRNVDDDIHAA